VRASRVLLVDLPLLTRELVTELLAGCSDVTIVGESSETELPDVVWRKRANVVIAAAEDAAIPDAVRMLLDEHGLRVVVLTNRGRTSTVAELVPAYTEIGELTPSALAQAVSGVAAA
jgi:DNA-binding NarL/FixJ family response regulator